MRAFFAFVTQGFRQQGAYKIEAWFGLLSSLIWFLLYLGIWRTILQGDPEAMTRQMAYVIASRFLVEAFFIPTWEVGALFRMGDVGLELIKPVPLPWRLLGDFLGRDLYRALRILPVYLVAWSLLGLKLPSLPMLLLFLFSAALSWVIDATLVLSLSFVALWTVQFDNAETIYNTLSALLSGSLLPLYYMPDWVAAVAAYLPFASTIFVPSAMLAGTLSGPALVQALVIQMVWAAAGLGLLAAMWWAGGRKLVAQGG